MIILSINSVNEVGLRLVKVGGIFVGFILPSSYHNILIFKSESLSRMMKYFPLLLVKQTLIFTSRYHILTICVDYSMIFLRAWVVGLYFFLYFLKFGTEWR